MGGLPKRLFCQQAWRFFLDNPIFTANEDRENDRLSETARWLLRLPSASYSLLHEPMHS